jgi:hypothetical protein
MKSVSPLWQLVAMTINVLFVTISVPHTPIITHNQWFVAK